MKQEPQMCFIPGLDSVFIANNDHSHILAKFLYAWKYKLWHQPGEFLQNIFTQAFCSILGTTEHTLCVPVPVHRHKLSQRGFNQAYELTYSLRSWTAIMVVNLLIRQRNTRSQVGLSRSERIENLQAAFCVNDKVFAPNLLRYRILLIDDILTSGTTLQQCAAELRSVGFKKIDALVLHRGTK